MGRWTSGVAASTNASRIAQAKKYSRLACNERVRQAEQAAYERAAKDEQEACARAICKHCQKLGIAQYDERLRTWVHHIYEGVKCDAWPILARMRARTLAENPAEEE